MPDAPFVANDRQADLARAWFDPEIRVVIGGGAIRSGKTQAAGRLLVETALEIPGLYLVSRLTYRELRDSTQKAMLHGDGALPPLIPPEAMDYYRASDELVRLRNGSEILFRSLDEPAKLLNLTLNAIFVDQIEELDEGDDGERLFNTLFGRLSDPRGPRKLIAVANPGPMTHWLHRRLVSQKSRDPGTAYIHFAMSDNAENLPADYVQTMYATEKTRPHWFRTFVLGEWGAFEGAAYEEFTEALHVVDLFPIPNEWERFQSMDHGQANPTCWLAWAVDHDGNVVIFDEYYDTGMVSKHCATVIERLPAWRGNDQMAYMSCYADPSIKANQGVSTRHGRPATVWNEYLEHGIDWLVPANNDRAAGYARLLELMHVEPGRIPPPFVSPYARALGASPRLFIFRTCENLVLQIKSAPIAAEGMEAGEAVDAKWERAHGHAHAALRYGALTWPDPTPIRPQAPTDERTFAMLEWEQRRNDALHDGARRSRYVNV